MPPKVGDIVEIRTARGLAYAQCTHMHQQYGHLLAVFRGFNEKRPESFNNIVNQAPRFYCFYPLQAAASKGIVEIVSNEKISPLIQEFPTFRTGLPDRTGRIANWWLWDGEREWQIGRLTAEQEKLSVRGIWNHTLLRERIESNWSPEAEV